VGRCLPDFEPLVIGADDQPVAAGTPGRLYFRDRTGRGIEYRNDPAKTAAAHREPGVFTIGDVGYVDDEGFVYVTDRADDMIITGGVNVYPAEIEQALAEHVGVLDVAVVAIPHPDLGQTPLALVEPAHADAPPDPDELIAHCRARLAHYKCPSRVEIVASVGRSAMGKLSRKALRRPYWPPPPGED
jgi:long-chain acyl-CoA synthetase